MQDFIPPEKRSIRNISIDRPQTITTDAEPEKQQRDGDVLPMNPRYMFENRPEKPWLKYGMWGAGAVVALVILFLIISAVFGGATVTITPRTLMANLDDSLTAYAQPASGQIGYSIVEAEAEVEREVPATGEQRVERPASGRIIVYNDYDDTPQKLVKNTRFQTPEGLIYRISESVMVPARTKKPDGSTTPGSIEVEVFADSPGEEYNIGLTDFTIPAFKENEDPRFDKYYARSKTEMSGGFTGVVKTASAEATKEAREEIQKELSEGLPGKLASTIPEGLLVVADTALVTFEELPNKDGATDGTVLIRMKGRIRAAALDGGIVAGEAARARMTDYQDAPVRFVDAGSISVKPVADGFDLAESTSLDVRVTGVSQIIWEYDQDALQSELAGVSRSATDDVFSTYPAIANADVVIKPFWKRSLPDDPEKITIREELSDEE